MKLLKNQKGFSSIFVLIITIILIIGAYYLGLKTSNYSAIDKKTAFKTDTAKTQDNIVAWLVTPTFENDKRSNEWIGYINQSYNFSFLIPAAWKVDLQDNNMHITILEIYHGGGGFRGVGIHYSKNDTKAPLAEYLKKENPNFLPNSLESFKTKNENISVLIERSTPGAGPGQTAIITNSDNSIVVSLYCGGCGNSEMDHIITTFDFDTERDYKGSWLSFI